MFGLFEKNIISNPGPLNIWIAPAWSTQNRVLQLAKPLGYCSSVSKQGLRIAPPDFVFGLTPFLIFAIMTGYSP
jgi:hypothetical protein